MITPKNDIFDKTSDLSNQEAPELISTEAMRAVNEVIDGKESLQDVLNYFSSDKEKAYIIKKAHDFFGKKRIVEIFDKETGKWEKILADI